MGLIEPIVIFNNRSITKNASIINTATPIHLGKCGPDAVFWADITASGAGYLGITYQIADNPDDTFYTPVGATILNRWKTGDGGASRDRVAAEIVGTRWVKFKVDELNASNLVGVNLSLIVAR